MTLRLFILWLRVGALTVMTSTGALFVAILAISALLMFREPQGSALARDMAMIVLRHLAAWAAGALLLSTAAWVFIDAVIVAFDVRSE